MMIHKGNMSGGGYGQALPELHRRLRWVALVGIAAFALLVGRLWQLQVMRGDPDERDPAQPPVELGQRLAVAPAAHVALVDHHVCRPSSAASRSRWVRAYAASMRRKIRQTMGPTTPVASAASATWRSSSDSAALGT